MTPAISLILPVYNVEQYLPRCVDSILEQSFSDFEAILVDDGSPDNCGAICDAYARKDPRLRVIHQKNAKLSAARNVGIEAAHGDWIGFIDPDDWIHKDYLKNLISNTRDDTDVVIGSCLITDNMTETDSALTCRFTDASLATVEADRIARTRAWGRLYRRSSIGDLRFISGTEPTEDSVFNELLFDKSMHFRITDAKLYYYYMRPDSAIHNNMGRKTLRSVQPMLDCLEKIDDREKRSRIILRCYKNVLHARYLEMFAADYAPVQKRCAELLRILAPYRKELDRKNRLIYSLLADCPLLYRLWRIKDDPTLIQFEREQKKRNKEQVLTGSSGDKGM